MARVAGLAGFLQSANLAGYLPEAEAFCQGTGAVHVSEVLEDEGLCGELVEHLQLKRLEVRRFEAAAERARAEPALLEELEAPEELEEASRAPEEPWGPPEVEPAAAEVAPAGPGARFFTRASWGSRRDRDVAKSGRGRGHQQAGGGFARDGAGRAESQPGVNPFFDCPAPQEPARGGHYFDAVDEPRCDAGGLHSGGGRQDHYFSQDEPSLPALGSGGASGRRRGGRGEEVEDARSQGGHYFDQPQAAPAAGAGGPRGRGGRRESQEERRGPGAEGGHYFGEAEPAEDGWSSRGPTSGRGGGAGLGSSSSAGPRGNSGGRGSRPAAAQGQRQQRPAQQADEPAQPSVLDALAERRRQEEDARAAKREAARQRRRQQDAAAAAEEEEEATRHEEGQEGSEGRRIDPADERAYTLQELRTRYRGEYAEAEIQRYWREDCRPAGQHRERGPDGGERRGGGAARGGNVAGSGGGGARGQSFYGAGAGARRPGAGGGPRRVDPDDGRPYTEEELRRKYQGAFSDVEIAAYWREECAPA